MTSKTLRWPLFGKGLGNDRREAWKSEGMRKEERTFKMGTTMVDTLRSLPVIVMKKGGAYYSLTMLKYATGRNANVIKTLLDLRNVNRSGVEDEAEQAENTDLEEEEVENSKLDFVVGEDSASDSAVLSIELGARAAGLLGEVGGTSGSELNSNDCSSGARRSLCGGSASFRICKASSPCVDEHRASCWGRDGASSVPERSIGRQCRRSPNDLH
jgi:hypothetical protein